MPFITGESRRMTDTIGPSTVGDRCFLHYREMLRAWRASPRWTTAHELYRDKVMVPGMSQPEFLNKLLAVEHLNDRAACELAWQVFFNRHVLPYEALKATENGEPDF